MLAASVRPLWISEHYTTVEQMKSGRDIFVLYGELSAHRADSVCPNCGGEIHEIPQEKSLIPKFFGKKPAHREKGLYFSEKVCYNTQANAPVAQWIEHQIPVLRVGGSSPFRRAKKVSNLP